MTFLQGIEQLQHQHRRVARRRLAVDALAVLGLIGLVTVLFQASGVLPAGLAPAMAGLGLVVLLGWVGLGYAAQGKVTGAQLAQAVETAHGMNGQPLLAAWQLRENASGKAGSLAADWHHRVIDRADRIWAGLDQPLAKQNAPWHRALGRLWAVAVLWIVALAIQPVAISQSAMQLTRLDHLSVVVQDKSNGPSAEDEASQGQPAERTASSTPEEKQAPASSNRFAHEAANTRGVNIAALTTRLSGLADQLRQLNRTLNDWLNRAAADRSPNQRRPLIERASRLRAQLKQLTQQMTQASLPSTATSLGQRTRAALRASALAQWWQRNASSSSQRNQASAGASSLKQLQQAVADDAARLDTLAKRWREIQSGQPQRAGSGHQASKTGQPRAAAAGRFRETIDERGQATWPGDVSRQAVPAAYREWVSAYFKRLNEPGQ
jgi:hypothetical protein